MNLNRLFTGLAVIAGVLPGLAGSCAQPGWGHARAATASSSLLEGPCRWPSRPGCAQGP